MSTEQQNNDINSEKEVLKRLLKAFSLNDLKHVFELIGDNELRRKDSIINHIIEVNSIDIIKKNVFTFFNLLKQHIYIFEFKGIFPNNFLDNYPYLSSLKQVDKNQTQYNLLYPTEVEVFDFASKTSNSIKFLIPIKIVRNKNKVIFYFNILERDLNALFETKVKVLNRNSEKSILDNLIDVSLFHKISLSPCDVNKGIKSLLKNDIVDIKKVDYKKDMSISSETMDENFLLKRDMPEVYNILIQSPIESTLFQILHEDIDIKYFACNPTKGTVSFSVFPNSLEGVTNIVNAILINN